MTLTLTYKVNPSTYVDLGATRLSTITGLVTSANQGTVGQSSIDVPDKGGLLDNVLGLRRFYAHESASPAGTGRLYSAFTTVRNYARGRFLTGADRIIRVSLVDMNNFLNTFIIHGTATAANGVRPAETDLQRIAWLLGSSFVSVDFVADHGLVSTTGAVNMSANDYRNSYAQDVLRDCGVQSGKNWFIVNQETVGDAEVFGLFYDFVSAEVFTSTLRLSDHPGDADGVTTFEMYPDVSLAVDPSQVVSAVNVLYTGGSVFRRDTDIGLTTAATYYDRQVNAPAPQLKDATAAAALADRYLDDNQFEDFTATVRVLLPKEYVGLIRAGHRISCRFDFFPTPYREFIWWRILEHTLSLDLGTEEQPKSTDYYNVTLKMTPTVPQAIEQFYTDSWGLGGCLSTTWPNPPGSGNLMVAFLAQRGEGEHTLSLSGSTSDVSTCNGVPVGGTSWTEGVAAFDVATGGGWENGNGGPIALFYRQSAASEPLLNSWVGGSLSAGARTHEIEIAGLSGGPTVTATSHDQSTSGSVFTSPDLVATGAGYIFWGMSYNASGPDDGASAAFVMTPRAPAVGLTEGYADHTLKYWPNSSFGYLKVSGAGTYNIVLDRSAVPRRNGEPYGWVMGFWPL